MSGARFSVLKGELARLERALGQFMIDIQTGEHGYTEVSPPLMVNDAASLRHRCKAAEVHDLEDLFQTIDFDAISERVQNELAFMDQAAANLPPELASFVHAGRRQRCDAGNSPLFG